jgi:hypothetical protein
MTFKAASPLPLNSQDFGTVRWQLSEKSTPICGDPEIGIGGRYGPIGLATAAGRGDRLRGVLRANNNL